MAERNGGTKSEGRGQARVRLELVGLASPGDAPKLLVQALDAKNKPLHSEEVAGDGSFALPAEALARAQRVVIGAPDAEGGVQADASVTFRATEFAAQISKGTLALAEGIWSRFHPRWTCVSGSVRHCRRRPWWFDSIVSEAIRLRPRLGSIALAASRLRGAPLAERLAPSLSDLVHWPVRCTPVCLGTVEVYRRQCCCWQIVFEDPRIDDLIRDLEVFVERLPPVPPPVDPLKTPFFPGGALNELALNAATDLAALRAMPRDQAAQYINGRAYLFHRLCHCGAPGKVGSGSIQPDGSFNICWIEPLRLLQPNCYEQYAYVVKQTIGSTTTTIYNGLAAGAWFGAGEHPVLSSYHPGAFTCNETGTGDGDAHVFLDLIGDTESHELTTPDATGWDRVAAPDAASGLLFPNIGPNASHLRNLGGAIELKFRFSLSMRNAPIDARYYRVSICRADVNGNPTGPRLYYGQGLSPAGDGLAWQKVVGADIVPESLGPQVVGAEANLYRIPYDDEAWVGSVRYHALLNTLHAALDVPPASDLASPAANHLVTLEVFNGAGERVRPLGTIATGQPGAEHERPFRYRRWFQPGGSVGDDTVDVPHAALTHLFCWDNRVPVADITRLVQDGLASADECQFLDGEGDATFAIEYRAYVPDARFQFSHGIGWLRGLNASVANGGLGSLPTPLSPGNVGKPPAGPVISGSNSFEQMLTRLDAPNPPTVLERCSFAVTLTTFAKTTNGENLNYPHAQETAAFALAINGGIE